MGWEQVEGKGDKIEFIKFEAGKATVIRVMDESPVSKWRHWILSAKRSVTCLGNGCPVCESIKLAKEAGITPVYSSVMRHTLHVINKSTNTLELLEQGKTFFDQLLVFKNNMGDLRDYDIKVIRTGKDKQTTYTMIPMATSGLTKEELAMYEANKADINEMTKPFTIEQTKGFMEGKSVEEIFGKEDEGKSEDLELADVTPIEDGDIPY